MAELPPERAFLDVEGVDDDAVREGAGWLLNRARTLGETEAALVVPRLASVDDLGRVFGAGAAASLRKHRRVSAGGLTIHLFFLGRMPATFSGPVLAVWVDDDQLATIERFANGGVCVVPWLRKDIERWRAAHNPVDLRRGVAVGKAPMIENLVVVEALRSLTLTVDLGTRARASV